MEFESDSTGDPKDDRHWTVIVPLVWGSIFLFYGILFVGAAILVGGWLAPVIKTVLSIVWHHSGYLLAIASTYLILRKQEERKQEKISPTIYRVGSHTVKRHWGRSPRLLRPHCPHKRREADGDMAK